MGYCKYSCNKLPQEVATGIGAINSGILGAAYYPIWYVGNQLVNGINHFLICKEIRSTKNKNPMIVGLIINIPTGDITGDKTKIVRIIEEVDLPEEANIGFQNATKGLVGVGYRPIAYIGSQVVRGINHYIIAEAKGIYPDADVFAVLMVINVFQNTSCVVSITLSKI